MKNKQKSFTLIELLVVIAILGLLSSIVLVSLNMAKTKAKDSVRKSNLNQIAKGLEAYYLDEGNSKYVWDTSREPVGWNPSTWQTWKDTPCEQGGGSKQCGDIVGAGPNYVCRDASTSRPDIFLEQLVQEEYFDRSRIDILIGRYTDPIGFGVYYRYSCDLQKYGLAIWLSTGECYRIGQIIGSCI